MKLKTLLSLGLAATVFGQPKDVLGWETLKWGMTVAQAAKVLGVKPEEKPYPHENTRILINASYGEVSIQTKKGSDIISMVTVIADSGSDYHTRDAAYTKLRAELVDKYGEPQTSRFYFDQWRFPSSLITLSTLTFNGDDAGGVNIVFVPTHGSKRL